MNKGNIFKLIIAVGMLASIVIIGLYIVNYDKSSKRINYKLDLSSDIVSEDPSISAANFIANNGTMGDLSEITQEFIDSYNMPTNADRRMAAFQKVKDAIVPDSPLLSGNEEEVIKNQTSEFPIYYEVRDVKVSGPSAVKPLVIHHNGIGPTKYDSVDVYVDFKSAENVLYWPTDTGGHSIITQMEAVDYFENVKVTLIKSDGLWYIYDVEDSEYKLNARMSTWGGKGKNDVSSEQYVVAEYQINYDASMFDELGGDFNE